jgi:hypothetical protein
MANLIIKPSAGGDLVIQGSDASPAITVGTTGTTTFAENASFTTGNIGTLTSATTFPAGHIIQTVSNSIDGDSTNISSTSYVRRDTMTKQITGVVSGNNVLIRINCNIEINMGDIADGGAVCIFRESTNIASHVGGHQFYMGNGQHNFYEDVNLMFLDTSPTVGTNNYYIGLRAYSNATIRIESGGKFNIILQEIQG